MKYEHLQLHQWAIILHYLNVLFNGSYPPTHLEDYDRHMAIQFLEKRAHVYKFQAARTGRLTGRSLVEDALSFLSKKQNAKTGRVARAVKEMKAQILEICDLEAGTGRFPAKRGPSTRVLSVIDGDSKLVQVGNRKYTQSVLRAEQELLKCMGNTYPVDDLIDFYTFRGAIVV